MKRIAIVGYGGIAPKHMEVLRAQGCEIVASVNKSEQRREQAHHEGGIPATYARLDEMLDREKPDGVVVCATFDQIFPVAMELVPRRIPALLEKPTGVSLAEFNQLCQAVAEHRAPQMVALNRRHYSVVNRAVADAGGPAAVRAVMLDWSEDPAHLRRKGFSDAQISRWVFSNSIHGLDLMTYLAGGVSEPRIVTTQGAGPLDWYMSLSGKSERGALVDFRSTWGSPGRWRLNICSADRRYVFAPLEKCEILERGVAEPRTIVPDEYDTRFKHGFYEQARLFLRMIAEGSPPPGCEMESARSAMTLAERLTTSCLSDSSESFDGHQLENREQQPPQRGGAPGVVG